MLSLKLYTYVAEAQPCHVLHAGFSALVRTVLSSLGTGVENDCCPNMGTTSISRCPGNRMRTYGAGSEFRSWFLTSITTGSRPGGHLEPLTSAPAGLCPSATLGGCHSLGICSSSDAACPAACMRSCMLASLGAARGEEDGLSSSPGCCSKLCSSRALSPAAGSHVARTFGMPGSSGASHGVGSWPVTIDDARCLGCA